MSPVIEMTDDIQTLLLIGIFAKFYQCATSRFWVKEGNIQAFSTFTWSLVDKLSAFFAALGALYRETPALYELDTQREGFSLTVADDTEQSVLVFRRIARNGDEVIAVCNFCPVLREDYRFGVSAGGTLLPIFSTEEERFGGRGFSFEPVTVLDTPSHGLSHSISVSVLPMSVTLYTLQKI